MHQQQTAFGNIAGKGEIAHNDEKLIGPWKYRITPNLPNYTELYRITPPNSDLNMQKTYFVTYILIRQVKIILSCFLWLTIV